MAKSSCVTMPIEFSEFFEKACKMHGVLYDQEAVGAGTAEYCFKTDDERRRGMAATINMIASCIIPYDYDSETDKISYINYI